MKSILLATDVDFWLENRGSRCRIANLIRALGDAGFSLHVFYTLSNYREEQLNKIQQAYGLASIRSMPYAPRPVPGRLERWLQRQAGKYYWFDRIWNGQEPRLQEFRDEGILKSFREVCASVDPDAVIIEYLRLSYLLEGIGKPVCKVLDTHDVMWKRYQRHREARKRHGIRIDREEESACYREFDIVMAIQEEEARVMRDAVDEKTKVITVGHPLEVKAPRTRGAGRLRLGFIGGNSDANREAAEWFDREVFRQHSDLWEWIVAGPVCHGLMNRVDQKHLIGQVEQVDDFYRRIDVLVNPVHFGGGLKIKNVEALAQGCPVLTTRLGAEGLLAGEEVGLLVAEEPEEYRIALERWLRDQDFYASCSEAAIRYAKDHFSPQAVCGDLIREIKAWS